MVAADRNAALPSETVPPGRARVVSPAAAGEQDGPASGGPHRRGSDLRGHDGPDDIDVVGLVQVSDVAAQQRVRRQHRCVVDQDPGRAGARIQRGEGGAQALRIAGIRGHGVDGSAGVG